MPCKTPDEKHRPKIQDGLLIPACVARPVSKSEIPTNPALPSGSCLAAKEAEGARLWAREVWCIESVCEWKDVARQARRESRTIHMGRIFGIMVEKNHELNREEKHRKFQYRVISQGNNVRTQDFESAISQDLGSSPASVEASKNIDCYGCFPGHSIQQADAEQAYVQAKHTGTETWVAIPEEAWPSDWYNYPEGVSPDAPDAKVRIIPKYERPV